MSNTKFLMLFVVYIAIGSVLSLLFVSITDWSEGVEIVFKFVAGVTTGLLFVHNHY